MKASLKSFTPLFFSLLLIACGGGGDDSSSSNSNSNAMSTEEQKQFVLDVMSDFYLYYDQMPSINLNDYDTPEEVLDALLVNPPDRFSYIGDRVAQQNFFEEGTYQGIGYGSIGNNTDNTQTILYVFDESAAGRPCPGSSGTDACLQRGDIILDSSSTNDTQSLSIDRNGSTFDVDLPIGLVQINTVLTTDIQMHNGVSVGYLALYAFLEPTVAELQSAFATFNQNNIDELVVDLRYNGGGRVSTAQLLASFIAGLNGTGSDVTRLEWNDRNTQENEHYPFLNLSDQLNLNRLYVLTLEGTCSASELLMNSMTGIGVDVVSIGQTTCGKPVGSVSFEFDDKVLQPLTFNVVNDLGNGDYFDGIDASCDAEDDPSRAFSNPSETMYAAALYHIANSTCPPVTAPRSTAISTSRKSAVFSPNPLANLK